MDTNSWKADWIGDPTGDEGDLLYLEPDSA